MRLRAPLVVGGGFGLGVAALLFACAEDDVFIENLGQDAATAVDALPPAREAASATSVDASGATDACPDGGCPRLPVCGDGVIEGDELCDDGDAGIGCSAACVFDPGYTCDEAGAPCRRTTCNDGKREGSEACDDGNSDFGDRCTPTCKSEPECPAAPGACTSVCGDGIETASEDCDDGNRDDGDGCSRRCTVEPGWTCAPRDTPAPTMTLSSVVRDFKMGWNVVGGGGAQTPQSGGHPDFENNAQNRGLDRGIVDGVLGAQGKMVYARAVGGTLTTTDRSRFDPWFRDVPNVNVPVVVPLMFTYSAATGTYTFSSTRYFPIDGRGFGNQGLPVNFHFTAETRFWFEYRGGEEIVASSDDDLWVFVNRRRAVDFGGVHGTMEQTVDLDAERTVLGLRLGSIYEVAIFKAERHTTTSSFGLKLTGFRDATSVCRR